MRLFEARIHFRRLGILLCLTIWICHLSFSPRNEEWHHLDRRDRRPECKGTSTTATLVSDADSSPLRSVRGLCYHYAQWRFICWSLESPRVDAPTGSSRNSLFPLRSHIDFGAPSRLLAFLNVTFSARSLYGCTSGAFALA